MENCKSSEEKPSLFMKKIRKQPKNSLEWKLQSILKRHLVREAVGKFSEHSTLAQQDMQNYQSDHSIDKKMECCGSRK